MSVPVSGLDENAWFFTEGGYLGSFGAAIDSSEFSIGNSLITFNAEYDPQTYPVLPPGTGQTTNIPIKTAMMWWNTMSLLYGTVEVKGRLSGIGAHSTFWLFDNRMRAPLYSSNGGYYTPASGNANEIDIVETCPNSYSNLTTVRQNIFSATASTVLTATTTDVHVNTHVYRVVWTPTSVTWFIDGVQTNQVTVGVPDGPMFFVHDLEMNDPCATANPANFPTSSEIDYVKAWDQNNNLVFFDDFNGSSALQVQNMTNLVFAQANRVLPAANVASATVAYSTSTVSSSYLIAFCWTSVDVVSSLTDSLGNTWAQITSIAAGGGNTLQLFHVPKNFVGGGANTVTVHYKNSNNNFATVLIAEYTGQDPNNPVDVLGNVALGSTVSALPASSAFATSANETIAFFAITGDTPTVTGTGNYTKRFSASGALLVDGPANTAGVQYTPTATLSPAVNADGISVLLRSSSSPAVGGAWVQRFRKFVNKR